MGDETVIKATFCRTFPNREKAENFERKKINTLLSLYLRCIQCGQ